MLYARIETQVVREDTIRRLGMKNPTVRTQSFNRPNLTYEIRPKKAGVLDEVSTLHFCGAACPITYDITR